MTQMAQTNYLQGKKTGDKCISQIKSQRYPIWSRPSYFCHWVKNTRLFKKIWPDVILSALIALCNQTSLSTPIPPVSFLNSYPTRPQEGHLFWEEEGKLSIITRRNRLVTRGHIHTFSPLMRKTHQKSSTQVTFCRHVKIQVSFVLRPATLPSCPSTSDPKTGEQYYSHESTCIH